MLRENVHEHLAEKINTKEEAFVKNAAKIDWCDLVQISPFQHMSAEETVKEITEMSTNLAEMFAERNKP